MNWDDARVVLAIARAGNFASAATALEMDETTIARRLKRFETATGTKMFVRQGTQQTPTEAGAILLRQAERLEVEAMRLASLSAQQEPTLSARVRLTATPIIAQRIIAPALPALYAAVPSVRLQLLCTNQNLSFARWETDLAVRMSRPTDGSLFVRKLADLPSAVYERVGAKTSDVRWLALPTIYRDLPPAKYVYEQLSSGTPYFECDDWGVLRQAAAAGLGRAVFGCYDGDRDQNLKRVTDPVYTREAWLLIHPDMRDMPMIRATSDWLIETFAALSDQPKPA
jgi:DNA-binding transcriptional LysR family regulator